MLRFQIQELIAQNEAGIVYRALDVETGNDVALQRFFPHGVTGGGLSGEEAAAYGRAIEQVAGVNHPALRAVIGGGCDPVDHMPYLITEWVEGESLHSILGRSALSPETVASLADTALEISESISQVLGREAVWVETDLHTIVCGDEAGGRGATFGFCPREWLGGHDVSRSVEGLVSCTAAMFGWPGTAVSDQAGHGLGGWLKWLQHAAGASTLREAREQLASVSGNHAPPPSRRMTTKYAKPTSTYAGMRATPATSVKRVKWPVIRLGFVAVAVTGLAVGGWLWSRGRGDEWVEFRLPPPVAKLLAKGDQQSGPTAQELDALQVQVDRNGGVFSCGQYDLLMRHEKSEVVVEGVLADITTSKSGKTLYLIFGGETGGKAVRGEVFLAKAPPELQEAALRKLLGKTVRLYGKVKAPKLNGEGRLLINLTKPNAIKVV